MHEHNYEIIMALAAGELDAAARTAAETEIAECAECRRDLQLQRIALGVLEEAPAVYLTATESARLHDAVRRELSLDTPVPARPKRRPAWARWVPLAVGTAAVFLAALVLAPTMLGGGDDDAAEMVAAQDVAEEADEGRASLTTVDAAEAPTAPEPALESAQVGGADDEAADFAEAPTTAAAAAGTEAPTDGTALFFAVESLDEALRFSVIDQLNLDSLAFRANDAAAKADNPEAESCLAQTTSPEQAPDNGVPVDAEPQIVGLVDGQDGVPRLLVAYVPPDVNDTVIATLELPTCRLLETIP